jgi:hypothetical protein
MHLDLVESYFNASKIIVKMLTQMHMMIITW